MTFGNLALTLTNTKYDTYDHSDLQDPFEVSISELRAKAIGTVGSRLHHTETPKFDFDLILTRDVRSILNHGMLWGDLEESFRTPPHGVRYVH